MAADSMSQEPQTPSGAPRRDYSGLIILGALSVLEVTILYVLIAVETPLTPLIRRALSNPIGIFTLVMVVVTLLIYGMVGFLSWARWLHRRRSRPEGAA